MMRLKSAIVERLTPAYKSDDKGTLEQIRTKWLPGYIEALDTLTDTHAYNKDTYLRPFGTELLDAGYGKMKERAKTAMRRIGAYLDGRIATIEELEEERLEYKWGIFF